MSIDKLNEFLDELYISMDSMSNKTTSLTHTQYNQLLTYGWKPTKKRTTLWQAINFLEEKIDGKDNNSRSTGCH